jgi:hypothetical protein
MWAAQDGNDRGARPCDRLAHAAVFPLLGSGFDSMKALLLFGRTKRTDLHRIAPLRFSPAEFSRLGHRAGITFLPGDRHGVGGNRLLQ